MIKKLIFGLVSVFSFFALIVVTPVSADSTVIVHPGDLATSQADVISNPEKWLFYNDEDDSIDNSLGSFVSGPGTPPVGDGSIEISVTGEQRRNLATYQFSGVKLSDITTLKFSTYNPSADNGGSVNRSGYLQFNVDFDGSDNWQKRLAYIPSKNGTVVQDSWQEWDAIDGGNALWWWSGFAANGNKWPDNNTNEYRTWSDLKSSFPNIALRTSDSFLGIRVGEPYNDGYTENIDAFKFGTASGTTTFDFDPEPLFQASGEITSPTDGEQVSGVLNLAATYTDNDEPSNDEGVQWAVRQGSCSSGTVLGNVDGKTDVAEWDGESFSFSKDVSEFTPGEYCFVFNPVDDAGEGNVRLERHFEIVAPEPEVVGPPTSVNECKKGGWEDFNNPTFRNQGQCVSYVVTQQAHQKLEKFIKNTIKIAFLRSFFPFGHH